MTYNDSEVYIAWVQQIELSSTGIHTKCLAADIQVKLMVNMRPVEPDLVQVFRNEVYFDISYCHGLVDA
jgi:hypothetical protein